MRNKFIYIILFSLLGSCVTNTKEATNDNVVERQIDTLPGAAPYLTKDHKNNLVLSWARTINDSVSEFCYTISNDGGQNFGKITSIPGTQNIQPHSENLPKLIFKPSGAIIALWGESNGSPKNKYSGMVFYCQSFNGGATWTTPRTLVTDTTSFDQRYFDVALLPSGEVAVIWLDNRKSSNNEGSALFFATTEGNKGFVNEKRIGEGCCQCCRTDLFTDSKGNLHVLYRGIIKDSIRDMLHSVSSDGGRNFSNPKLVSNDNWVIRGCPHTGPSMTENSEGLHFAWFTGAADKGCFYTQSVDKGNSFKTRQRISISGSHPQITSAPDGTLLIAWDEAIVHDDKPYRRIAIQQRKQNGEALEQKFITTDTSSSSYPVILSLDNISTIVAYTKQHSDRSYIMLQRVMR